jgi:hypothetical protein
MSSVLHVNRMNGRPANSGPLVEKVFVTPEMAAGWLAKNVRNRSIVERHLLALEEVLSRGEWVLNGDTIRFGKDGLLKDGQHRLTACVNTGIGFWTFVAYGLEEDAFDTIDTNSRPRRVADVLDIHGRTKTNALAACVKLLWIFRHTGQFYDGGGGRVGFSPKVCLEILERRPSIESFVASATNSGRVFPSGSLLSALGYLFSHVDQAMAEEMFKVMAEGSRDVERPFNVLREAMINRRVTGTRMGTRSLAFMAIRAWNSEISAVWIKRVYYKPNEEFPTISGLDYGKLDEVV